MDWKDRLEFAVAGLMALASLASGVYGFFFFPEPNAWWITRLLFGFLGLVLPMATLMAATALGLAASVLAGVAALVYLAYLVLAALFSETPW